MANVIFDIIFLIEVCPTGTLTARIKGYRVLLQGKLGRHPRLAKELPGIYQEDELVGILERCLHFYKKRSKYRERFAEIFQDTKSLGVSASDISNEKKSVNQSLP